MPNWFRPDYGGEQVRNLVTQRRIPAAWRNRVLGATDWVLLDQTTFASVRSTTYSSRPLQSFAAAEARRERHLHTSRQIKRG